MIFLYLIILNIKAYSKEIVPRSEENTSELQSHAFVSYAVFCLKKKEKDNRGNRIDLNHYSLDFLIIKAAIFKLIHELFQNELLKEFHLPTITRLFLDFDQNYFFIDRKGLDLLANDESDKYYKSEDWLNFNIKRKLAKDVNDKIVLAADVEFRKLDWNEWTEYHKHVICSNENEDWKKLSEEIRNYKIDDLVCSVLDGNNKKDITLVTRWPVRVPRPFKERLPLKVPLITGQRVIDMLFPVAKGGAVAVPGGFGTGKTIIQHQLAKWSDADIIVFIGCGERGNEMTDVLSNFPKLKDPRTGLPLMERTIIIANTSNMPVAAREASIYTGTTLAEYYRDMGYHVAVMADSTSRWAEALRELSGRMEEMPADEGFPAYLPTRLAEFYERASLVKSAAGKEGSVTIIGSVSPPGGDFSEPVTQHTKRFIRCFWALDRQLANARHYPSISWVDSYSEYVDEVKGWWQAKVSKDWEALRNKTIALLNKETRLQQIVKLVGPDVLPDSQKIILTACQLIKDAFLQQNAFDKIDMFSYPEKQYKMLDIIISFYERALEQIKKGATLVKIRKLQVYQEIMRMKFTIANDQMNKLDELKKKLEESFASLGGF